MDTIARDWRNRPYPEPKPAPAPKLAPDVSVAACRARARRQERNARIAEHVIIGVGAWAVGWFLDLSRAELLALAAVYLALRILDRLERQPLTSEQEAHMRRYVD